MKLTGFFCWAILGTGLAWAKLPFMPSSKINVEEWKDELNWPEELVGKMILAQTNHQNKAKLIKDKLKKERAAFEELLNRADPDSAGVQAVMQNIVELEKSQMENDSEFILQVKKLLQPDQQEQLLKRMAQKKKKSQKKDEPE